MNLKDIFCSNLKSYSKDKNITISQMAKKLNLSISTVSDWYNGVNFPRFYNLNLIANVLEIPVEYLLKEKINNNKEVK